ncbi:MAG: site-specific integrase [Phycisphaerae bacterium]
MYKIYKVIDEIAVAPDQHIKAIRTNQSPYWYLQYQAPGGGNGRQRRKSLHTTSKKEAQVLALRFAAKFVDGQVPCGNAHEATLTKLIALRMEELRQAQAMPNTLRLNTWYFDMLCADAPQGGRTSASILTPAFLTTFAGTLSREGVSIREPARDGKPHKPRTLAPKTVREALKAVRRLGKIAEHFLGRDPCRGYKLPRGNSPEIETFSPAELTQIFVDPYLGATDIWKFLFLSGLRISEFTWLTKDDVVLGGDGLPTSIHVRKKTIHGVTWVPKHGLHRLVPLVPEAATILGQALTKSPGPWAFYAPDTTTTLIGQWQGFRLRYWLHRRLDACGIGHGTLHVFRHTCATFMANVMKIPLPLLQKFLGHRSIETTMRYLHANCNDVAAAVRDVGFTLSTTPTVTPSNNVEAVKPDNQEDGKRKAE